MLRWAHHVFSSTFSENLNIMGDERRNLIERIRLAEAAQRWDDMVAWLRTVVAMGTGLTVEERNLLANGYKNYVGCKRAAWRAISIIEQEIDTNQRRKEISKEYRRKIEEELKATCSELLQMVDKYLLNTIDNESLVFYHKMKGDYYRYLSEFCRENSHVDVYDKARESYETGLELAKEFLSPANPLRLGLVLNYSVFHYEILNSYEAACELAKQGHSLAEEDINSIAPPSKDDSILVMHLLKDNMKIWTAEMEEEAKKK